MTLVHGHASSQQYAGSRVRVPPGDKGGKVDDRRYLSRRQCFCRYTVQVGMVDNSDIAWLQSLDESLCAPVEASDALNALGGALYVGDRA